MTGLLEWDLLWNGDRKFSLVTFLKGRVDLTLELRVPVTVWWLVRGANRDVRERVMMCEVCLVTSNSHIVDG